MSNDTATRGGPTLVAKLVEVMKAVKRIPKRGWNDHFKYQFATEADVVDLIRTELVKQNVLFVPEIVGVERLEKGLTQLHMRFTFMDADCYDGFGQSGCISRDWWAQGLDTQDKGISKASTSGEKYFLLKFFLIPTGDDPDAATPGKKRQQSEPPPAAEFKADPNDTRPISAEQVKRLKGMMRTHNTNVDEFKAWAEARFKVKRAEDVKRCDYDRIIRYVTEGTEE